MKTKSKKPKEVLVPLEDIKKLEEWPRIKKAIDNAVADFKTAYPSSLIEMKETKYTIQIWIDGQPELEMDALDLKISSSAYNKL